MIPLKALILVWTMIVTILTIGRSWSKNWTQIERDIGGLMRSMVTWMIPLACGWSHGVQDPWSYGKFLPMMSLGKFEHIGVINKVGQLGGENGQFRHSRASNAKLLMKILQKEIRGTQTRFSTNFGGKLTFIMCFLFPERLRCCYIYNLLLPLQLL